MEVSQMLPDVVSRFSEKQIKPNSDKSLLGQIVYAGKKMYLQDILLPNYDDAKKIGYTVSQIDWCIQNEAYMWRYFLENEMLYSKEQKLSNRFVNAAPFSKFYLEIDNESPGRVGVWLGWQIVRSYMNNNEVSLQQMLKMDAKELFEKSKYKPNKNVE